MSRATILALLLATTAASAEERQHGNMIFDLPDGWTTGAVRPDGTLTLLTTFGDDQDCRFCYAYVTTGQRGRMAPDRFLRLKSTLLLDEDETSRPTVMMGPDLIDAGGREAAIMGQTVGDDVQLLMAIRLGDRLELVAFEGAADADEIEATMAVFLRDIVPMVEAARFVSEGATPLLPVPRPGPLEGLYWGFSTSWGLGLDGMMQMSLDNRHISFWADGTFYDGTAPRGLAGLDQRALIAAGDMDWGSYTVRRNALRLAYASGETEELALTDGGIDDGTTTLRQVETLPDGSRIDGVLTTFRAMGFTPGVMSGGVTSGGATTFLPDGTWTQDRWSAVSGTFESNGTITGGFAGSSESGEAGSYEVQDGQIVQFQKGRPVDRNWLFRLDEDVVVGTLTLE